MSARPSGTEGYGETAAERARQYESVGFADVHRDILHLFPATPSQVIDIGAGTGRDAAAFAERGHSVTAVEPTPELRAEAQRLHARWPIIWIDDSLPDLDRVHERGERYDVVMLTAVWMHLDAGQRERAMARVAPLVRPRGLMALSLRHARCRPADACSRSRPTRQASWPGAMASRPSTKAKAPPCWADPPCGGIGLSSGLRGSW